jgi:hypothetical protein
MDANRNTYVPGGPSITMESVASALEALAPGLLDSIGRVALGSVDNSVLIWASGIADDAERVASVAERILDATNGVVDAYNSLVLTGEVLTIEGQDVSELLDLDIHTEPRLGPDQIIDAISRYRNVELDTDLAEVYLVATRAICEALANGAETVHIGSMVREYNDGKRLPGTLFRAFLHKLHVLVENNLLSRSGKSRYGLPLDLDGIIAATSKSEAVDRPTAHASGLGTDFEEPSPTVASGGDGTGSAQEREDTSDLGQVVRLLTQEGGVRMLDLRERIPSIRMLSPDQYKGFKASFPDVVQGIIDREVAQGRQYSLIKSGNGRGTRYQLVSSTTNGTNPYGHCSGVATPMAVGSDAMDAPPGKGSGPERDKDKEQLLLERVAEHLRAIVDERPTRRLRPRDAIGIVKDYLRIGQEQAKEVLEAITTSRLLYKVNIGGRAYLASEGDRKTPSVIA